MTKQGGCTCGAIRFSLTNSPMIVHACHCRDCQRAAGAPFVLNMWIEESCVIFSGESPSGYQAVGGSGKPVDLYFCSCCGTTVYSRYHAAPLNSLWFRAGCLDDPSDVEPDVHIYTCTQQPWMVLPENVRRFDEYYDMREVWSEASLARFQRLLAAGH